jgi:dCMP deaminase
MNKWDMNWLAFAREVSNFSKDPSTKVGAVIIRGKNNFVQLGYNGFAKRIKDTTERLNDRDLKYPRTMHAELNAVLFSKQDLTGCTIYVWPFQPCHNCANVIIQSDIGRVVAPVGDGEGRWAESFTLAREFLDEASVPLELIEQPVSWCYGNL